MTTLKRKNLHLWMSRFTVWLIIFASCVLLSGKAYAADAGIQMGSNGNLIFEPNEVTVNVGDTVTFTNGELPPHNVVFAGHDELSHPDLAFMSGEQFPVTFTEAGDFEFQCDPHAGAGMKRVIHVE